MQLSSVDWPETTEDTEKGTFAAAVGAGNKNVHTFDHLNAKNLIIGEEKETVLDKFDINLHRKGRDDNIKVRRNNWYVIQRDNTVGKLSQFTLKNTKKKRIKNRRPSNVERNVTSGNR